MKNPNTFKKFLQLKLLLFICLFMVNIGQSQGLRILATNWGNAMLPFPTPGASFQPQMPPPGMCLLLLNDHELHIQLTTSVALPDISGYPPMFMQFELNGMVINTPVFTNADLNQVTVNGLTYYEIYYLAVYDLESYCQNPANVFHVEYEFSLRTYDGFTTPLYPIHNYSGSGDLFDADIFYETDNGLDPFYYDEKQICCPGVKYLVAHENENTVAQSVAFETSSKTADNINETPHSEPEEPTVFPVLFSDQINVKAGFEEPLTSSIAIRNLNGQLLYEKEFPESQQFQETLNLPSYDWVEGIYLLILQNEKDRWVKKVVKE